jgi:hypothetical protein
MQSNFNEVKSEELRVKKRHRLKGLGQFLTLNSSLLTAPLAALA